MALSRVARRTLESAGVLRATSTCISMDEKEAYDRLLRLLHPHGRSGSNAAGWPNVSMSCAPGQSRARRPNPRAKPARVPRPRRRELPAHALTRGRFNSIVKLCRLRLFPSPGTPGEGRVRVLLRRCAIWYSPKNPHPALSRRTGRGRKAEVADHRVLGGDAVHAVAVIELEGGGVPRIDGET